MRFELIIAGFGGQGVIFAGQLLARAGLEEGKSVVWTPSYGPEMRGGESQCSVIISSSAIGSPVVAEPDAAILMDRAAAGKFARGVKSGGLLLINSSLVPRPPRRGDVECVSVAANEIAERIGGVQVANLVLVGALLELRNPVAPGAVRKALAAMLPPHRQRFLPLNEAALAEGAKAAAGLARAACR
jgi:2-oxoglutarate ferredoxin oxidoreductase subunit gamma